MLQFFHSYRGRLIIYSIALMISLSGTLLYSYHYVSSLISSETDNHIERVAQLSNSRLKDMRASVKGYAEIVKDDLRLQEYMFVVTNIGSDIKPLKELYEKHFGWFNVDRHMILSRKAALLVGEDDPAFIKRIQPLLTTSAINTNYIGAADGMEIVAIAPIKYRDSVLGYIVLSKHIGQKWLAAHHDESGVMAFFAKDGEIISSCTGMLNGKKIKPGSNYLEVADDSFQIRQQDIKHRSADIPRLWFAVKNTEINARLNEHRKTTFLIIGFSISAITLFGLLLIRNFTRPLTQLMDLTRSIVDGKLPNVVKTNKPNEVAALSNHFADMVHALKDKQDEIDKVHAALEKSAITDMLTGLYNRRYLQVVFPKLVGQAQRDNNKIAAILIDLDHFKIINDEHGHITGDMCLTHFSDELKKYSRTNDYLFRIGGEEFLILSITEDIAGITHFAEKLRAAIEESPVRYQGLSIGLTISCGISIADSNDPDQTTLTQMLSKADKAMYKAKEKGRNRVCLAPGLDTSPLLRRI